jgi:hypothetical protein
MAGGDPVKGTRIAAVAVAVMVGPFASAWARSVSEWGPVTAALLTCALLAWGLLTD